MSNPGLPDRPELEHVLSGLAGGVVTVLERTANPYESTFPTEIVVCRLADGVTRELFCKYSAGQSHSVYGHRGDVGYEAHVYRRILENVPAETPRLFGVHETADGVWLVIERVRDGIRASKSTDPEALPAAARWAAGFHRALEGWGQVASGLRSYDGAYYRGWMERTVRFSAGIASTAGRLEQVSRGYETVVESLLAAPQTVIHGEYYTRNVLYARGLVYPVDWESAAVAPGEIDLAMLVEGWPADEAARCVEAYAARRWPEGAPTSFARVLDSALVYVLTRWLGDRRDWTLSSSYRFEELWAVSERLGLL